MTSKESSFRIAIYAALGLFLILIFLLIWRSCAPEPTSRIALLEDEPVSFMLQEPMEIRWIRDDVYNVTVIATDYANAEVWWKNASTTGKKTYAEFDKIEHTFTFTDLPKNDSIYIGAMLVQKHEPNTAKFHTYQAGTFIRTDNFQILNTEQEDAKIRVFATQKSEIWFSGGETKSTVTTQISYANNPTEIEPGKWRHSATLPTEYEFWSAVLKNNDGHLQYTGIIESQ